MARRIYVPELRLGELPLPPEARHHLVDVLRLAESSEIEPFTSTGERGRATLHLSPKPYLIVHGVLPPSGYPRVTVASAVPKGERADYLVEKLAELGVARWVPLQTGRAVVLPKGESKRVRWDRIAQEAARQSHASGVLQIAELVSLDRFAVAAVAGDGGEGTIVWFASTSPDALSVADVPAPSCIIIGPEGGFTPAEEQLMRDAGCVPITLGRTILRVETAAVIAAYAAINRHP